MICNKQRIKLKHKYYKELIMNISILLQDTAMEIEYCKTPSDFCFYLKNNFDVGIGNGFTEEKNMKIQMLPIITIQHENKKKIVVNKMAIAYIHTHCWLYEKVTCETLEHAFIINEAAKERYNYLNHKDKDRLVDDRYNKYKEDIVFKYIHEVLFQSMCEYRLGVEFPEFARYLALLNAVVKVNPLNKIIDDDTLKTMLKNSGIPKEAFDYFKLCMRTISDLAKYNSIGNLKDLSFANYSLPLILSAKRGSCFEVIQTSILLFEWLIKASSSFNKMEEMCKQINEAFMKGMPEGQSTKSKLLKQGVTHVEPISKADISNVDKMQSELKIKERFEEIAEAINGMEASTEYADITIEDATQFYIDTVKKYLKKISELEKVFRNAFTTMKQIRAFDGDINLKLQQLAYVSSLTHEDAKVYQYYMKKKISVDVFILRDISGSTNNFKQAYAEAIIILLAAIENIEGIRTMQIDFNMQAFINKSFDTVLKIADIGPKALGGTEIIDALNIVLKTKTKGKKQILFIMSDGAFSSTYQTEMQLKELKMRGFDIYKMAVGSYRASGFDYVPIEDIDKYIAKKIIESGLVDNG
jgi:hypothetical protein